MDSSLSDIETDALEEHVEISGVSEKDSFPEWLLHVEHPMLKGKKDYSSVVEPRLALGNKRTYFDCASKEYSDQNPYRPEHGSDMADDSVYQYEFLYETYVKNDRLGYLPNGWTQMKNDCGRVYYSDSNTRTTTFEDPRIKLLGKTVPDQSIDSEKLSQLLDSDEINLPSGVTHLVVSRGTVFEDSMSFIMGKTKRSFKQKLNVKFRDEEGQDTGGVTRDFFTAISRELKHKDGPHSIFTAVDEDSTHMYFDYKSDRPSDIDKCKFVGRLFALAVVYQSTIDIPLAPAFYKRMLNKEVELEDLNCYNPPMYRSFKNMLNEDVGEYDDITFSDEYSTKSKGKVTTQLYPGNELVKVSRANKNEFVNSMTVSCFQDRVKKQFMAFKMGFEEFIPLHVISSFNEKELELLIHGVGADSIDIIKWKQMTVYENCSLKDSLIKWFWEIISKMDKEHKRLLLKFTTGLPRAPVYGFLSTSKVDSNKKTFQIEVDKDLSTERLPESQTCFYKLILPRYTTFEQLRSKLLYAIENCDTIGNR